MSVVTVAALVLGICLAFAAIVMLIDSWIEED